MLQLVMSYHHKSVKRFGIEGSLHDEAQIDRLRTEYTNLLVSSMRVDGYVSRVDIHNDFTISYDDGSKSFEFKLTVYGVYVGKRRAQEIKYLDGFKPVFASNVPVSTKSVDSPIDK